MPDAGALTADMSTWFADSSYITADMNYIGDIWIPSHPDNGPWVEQDVDNGPWVEQVIPSWGS